MMKYLSRVVLQRFADLQYVLCILVVVARSDDRDRPWLHFRVALGRA
jgi:hypothetical protein